MSAIYDNWEKLVGAVLKKEELWQLFHEQSRSPSISSSSSGFSFSHLNSSLDADLPFPFSSPQWSASNHNRPDDLRDHSPVETLTPNKNVSFAPPRKRDLKIEVPKLRIEDRGFGTHCSEHRSNVSPSSKLNPRSGGGRSESHTKGNDDAKQDSYVLPLPPASKPDSPLPNSAVKLPLPPLLSPESVRSPVSPWKKGKLIGRGPLGDVYLGFNSEKGQMCVMKEFSLYSDGAESKQCARMLEKEIALLSRINHPNIVQYYGSETVAENLYIYYEYVSGGSISMLLQQYGRLGESAIRSYTQQILSGISYLHSKSIAHRDIKGTSVLVDPNGRVKLCNFALEKQITKQYRASWLMGSSYWMAPEVITNPNERKLAVDIWSLGCTIFEMATSRPPLSQYNEVIAMHKIANHKDLPTFPDHLSDVCKDFLRLCLQWNPVNRPTASQLLEHPFVKTLSPLGKQLSASPSSGHATATSTVKSEGTDRARSPHQLDSGKVVYRSSKASKSNIQSDIYTPRNISAPVSPVGSPLQHIRSPQHLNHNKRMSPPPKSSAASTPMIGAFQFPHPVPSMIHQETLHNLPKQSPNFNNPSYWDPIILRGVFKFS